jgi:MFS family permease
MAKKLHSFSNKKFKKQPNNYKSRKTVYYRMHHNPISVFLGKVRRDLKHTPKKVARVLTGFSLFWFGWAIADRLLSVYLETVVGSYTLIGLMFGVFFLVSTLGSIPLGSLADKVSQTRLMYFLMLTYIPVAILYVLSGFTTAILGFVLLLFGRMLHGIGAGERTLTEAYIRKNSVKKHTAGIYGLYMTVHYGSAVLGTLVALLLISVFNIQAENLNLLFLVSIPFVILSAWVLKNTPSEEGGRIRDGVKKVVVEEKIVGKELKDFTELGFPGSVMILAVFFYVVLHIFVWIYLPVYVLKSDLGLFTSALFLVMIGLPYTAAFLFAELIDIIGKKKSVFLAFFGVAVILTALSFMEVSQGIFLAMGIILSIFLAILAPGINGIITEMSPKLKEGQISGVIISVTRGSELIASLGIGIMLDFIGFGESFRIFATVAVLMGVLFLFSRKQMALKQKSNPLTSA